MLASLLKCPTISTVKQLSWCKFRMPPGLLSFLEGLSGGGKVSVYSSAFVAVRCPVYQKRMGFFKKMRAFPHILRDAAQSYRRLYRCSSMQKPQNLACISSCNRAPHISMQPHVTVSLTTLEWVWRRPYLSSLSSVNLFSKREGGSGRRLS